MLSRIILAMGFALMMFMSITYIKKAFEVVVEDHDDMGDKIAFILYNLYVFFVSLGLFIGLLWGE